MLDEHPNVMVEFGAREAELGRQPRQTREFFLKYQDRVMFGTDNGMDEEMYRNHFRWLETADESFDPWGFPGQGRWEIYGLDLPDPVLEKIYHLNAEKMFSQFKGGRAMKPAHGSSGLPFYDQAASWVLLTAMLFLSLGCNRPPAKTETPAPEPSQIKVEIKPGGPIVLTTSAAEFQILPSGYIQAALLKGDQRLTLDQPGTASSDFLMLDGKPVQFTLDSGRGQGREQRGQAGPGQAPRNSGAGAGSFRLQHSANAASRSL